MGLNKHFFSAAIVLALIFTVNVETAFSQFQTLPQTERMSISGEKFKVQRTERKQRNHERYMENGNKKRKGKAKRTFVRGQSVSNFHIYKSTAAQKRNRALAKRRRRLS